MDGSRRSTARETTMSERPRVVVGIDGSAESRAALQFALEEAARRGRGVRVISALLPPQYWPEAYGVWAPPTIDEVKADLRSSARRMVDEVVRERPDLAVVPVELHEVEGRPGTVLIAQSGDADLLVVGHRGRGGLASAVLGSVGLQCLLHAECPVTVVGPGPRPQAAEEKAKPTGERVVVPTGWSGAVIGPLY
jgi:nucleotide-binding universal stress UspA family protein